ncbi:MAG TPA: DNA polymerase III subunit delta [Solirubrobacteraceae bacterium]|nr:DNA polymerase III subunit delta [Solirubrobacteraceae bacterium]
MPSFKPAYLIYGNDHPRVGERRARLRGLADAQSDAGGVEVIEGDAATPESVAAALCTMTFAVGRRFLIVDGVERWREADVTRHLAGVLADMPDETTVAFFAREDGRAKAPAALHAAVKRAGGDISEQATLKAWDLPKWAQAHARSLGLELDAAAARTLVLQVGERQQRLARELEKLAVCLGPGATLDAELVGELAAGGAERKLWVLGDAVVAGDGPAAARLFLRLRSQGERVESIAYWVTKRVREALTVALSLEAGDAPALVRRSLRMPPKAADRFIADVRRTDSARLRLALVALADLELETRGGSELAADTLALAAIRGIAA